MFRHTRATTVVSHPQEVGLDPKGHSKGTTGPVKDADGDVLGLIQPE